MRQQHVIQQQRTSKQIKSQRCFTKTPKFYIRCGWTPNPAPAIVLNVSLCNEDDLNATNDDNDTCRLLYAEDIKELCDQDVSALIEELERAKVPDHHSIMTVLPTHDLIRWQHA